MSKLAINSETLKGVADAIRAKTGKSELMTASQMAEEISGIQAGGSGDVTLNSLIDRSISVVESDVMVVGSYSFGICSYLSKASFPNAIQLMSGAFVSCESLRELYIPKVEVLHDFALSGCGSLTKLDFENLTQINSQALSYTVKLTTLIIRTPSVCKLNADDVFEYSAITGGEGYIYVPREVADLYKMDMSWSPYAEYIRAIEEYPDITGG